MAGGELAKAPDHSHAPGIQNGERMNGDSGEGVPAFEQGQRLDQAPAGSSEDDSLLEGRPKRVAIFVEPSPWSYTSGYKNRYQNFIRFLREQGDEVLVITTHEGAPKEWYGAKVVPSYSVEFPFYSKLRLSLALSFRIFNIVRDFKPDVIHAASPGIMVMGALVYSYTLQVPIIMTYHTHLPVYIPKYKIMGWPSNWLVNPAYLYIRALHNLATFTMTMSEEMRTEMLRFGAARPSRIRVWKKAVDSEQFHPSFASTEWRNKLSGGHPERPLIVHVGRLGQEKQLSFIKLILERIPEASLAFVGDGPHRPQLEEMFQDTPTVFTGMLSGADLSAAYASSDVFFTPSETETLGLVALEAMACGTPVVAVRAGGFINIVDKEGETGFLYTPGDIDDAVAKLRKLLFDKEFNRKIAAAARKDVERYDWRASTRQVRRDGYDMAIRLWRKAQRARQSWRSWLPWTWFAKLD
ncbi:sulfoquinovosyldiacylglycerol synthase [Klebsormidium nitens]|uniref:Sulfoquinovosyldiacylglycerol synthase n=1 Tax=Klebsormidium nitens TaxID=105231 RepID=A0A1Y1HMQ9_KLENI|nr:sulfoquinovosyldiacylglycerol synthase [Klebsormidium nitens]|eukprot:GAQ79915.1 sulfoquinovosyldiacylglycerol synthase [Klebsormidium nitens]